MPVMRFSPAAGTQRVALISRSAMPARCRRGLDFGLSIGDETTAACCRKITGFFERRTECGY